MRVTLVVWLRPCLMTIEDDVEHNAEGNSEKKHKQGDDDSDQSGGTEHPVSSNETERARSVDAKKRLYFDSRRMKITRDGSDTTIWL